MMRIGHKTSRFKSHTSCYCTIECISELTKKLIIIFFLALNKKI